jgi:hypothetical protein
VEEEERWTQQVVGAGYVAEYPYRVPTYRRALVRVSSSHAVNVYTSLTKSGPVPQLERTLASSNNSSEHTLHVSFPPETTPEDTWYLVISNISRHTATVKHIVITAELSPTGGATGTTGGYRYYR